MPTHLLATKLYAPPQRANLVARPQLLARLTAGLNERVTVIVAPAGFGKTTLLSAWIADVATLAPQVAWVSFDAADSDPIRFWSYLIAALESILPDIGGASLALLQSSQAPAIEHTLVTLINALSALPTDTVLVLEDYHLIDSPVVHEAMAFWIDHLPRQVHLVIATRVDPPLPLARWRARGQLTEIRASELRFSLDETATFLTEVMRLPLSLNDIAALETRTEGWVAGLQLAALAMRDRRDVTRFVGAFTGSNRFVVDYLASEVLDRLPTHLHHFLLQTVILDQLCGPLCDAVLGVAVSGEAHGDTPAEDSYSQLLLRQIAGMNLFLIPLDDERRWYRYHHLFAEMLQAQLRATVATDRIAMLHRRASHWFEQHGMDDKAVRHALAAKDDETAARLIIRYGPILLGRGELVTLQGWLQSLPHEIGHRQPQLNLLLAWVYFFTGQWSAVEPLLVDIEAAISASVPPQPFPDRQALLGEVAAIRGSVAAQGGQAARAVAFCQVALAQLLPDALYTRSLVKLSLGEALLIEGDLEAAHDALSDAVAIGQQGRHIYTVLYAFEYLIAVEIYQGRLQRAAATIRQALALGAHFGDADAFVLGRAHVDNARLSLIWNDLAAAEQQMRVAITFCTQLGHPQWLVCGFQLGAAVSLALGQHADTLDYMAQAEAVIAGRNLNAFAISEGVAVKVRLWLAQGNIVAAARWAAGCGLHAGDEPGFGRLPEYVALARVLLAQGLLAAERGAQETGLALLERLLRATERTGWHGYLIECLALHAVALQALGDLDGAVDTLARAVALAEPEGYVRVFVDEGAAMASLLRVLALRGGRSAFVARLLEAIRVEVTGSAASEAHGLPGSLPVPRAVLSTTLIEQLTPREREVLALLAEGASNRDIAEQFTLSLGTVKKHVNNILGKLDARSRTQAIAKARDLQLL